MAVIYVDSNNGGAGTAGTYADPFKTLFGATNTDAVNGSIYIASNHSETVSGAVTYTLAGTVAAPASNALSVTMANPPTTLTAGAIVQTTGANADITITGAGYWYGVTFKGGDSTNRGRIILGALTARSLVFENCTFDFVGTSTASYLMVGSIQSHIRLINCTVKFSNAAQVIVVNTERLEIDNLTIDGASTIPTAGLFFLSSTNTGTTIVRNSDLSAMTTNPIVKVGNGFGGKLTFVNCKMGANWVLTTGTASTNDRVEAYNCDSGDTNYTMRVMDQSGTMIHDTGIYCSGTTPQAAVPLSWRMVSGTQIAFPHQTLVTPEIVQWNAGAGSSLTATVEFLIDSNVTLNKNDVYMELSYQGTSGYSLGTTDRDSKEANILATPTECATGTGLANWAGDSGSGKSYKLVSTFTPQEAGFLIAKVHLAKASTTIYVDPLLTVAAA